jgi:hypothetical protein
MIVLELRTSRLTRALYAGSIVVAAGMLGFILTGLPLTWVTAVFLLFLAGIMAHNGATVVSRVRAGADGSLEVRNRFRTRALRREDVDRVMLGRQGGFGSPARVELLLTDGSKLPLVATDVPPLPPLLRTLNRQAGELRAWIDGTLPAPGLF